MTRIIDTTLREGEQTPGVFFRLEEKKRIIDGLVQIGIKEIELGIASPLTDCADHLARYCRMHHTDITSSLWSRCKANDIEHAAAIGPDILSLSIPVSDLLIRDKLGKDREWIKSQLRSCILRTKERGMRVAVGFEDATRADLPFLLHMAQLAERSGASRIRLADTVGTASPLDIQQLVTAVNSALHNCTISLHCHNDFGMATANAITALSSGADSADATIMGLGERCGCARLEELAGFLTLQGEGNYHLDRIGPLSRYVARISRKTIPTNRPFLGKDIFTCETGLHLQALQKNLKTYEPYPPETIGMRHNLVVGGKAGRRAIAYHLLQLGLPSSELDNAKTRSVREMLQQDRTAINECGDLLN